MALDEKDLLRMKKDIEGAKQKLSELKGQKDFIIKDLKEKWGCDSIEDARKQLNQLTDEERELDSRIQKELGELEREYQQL